MIIKKILLKSFVLIMLTVSTANAQGNWFLDKRNSHVSFFTLKKDSVGEFFGFSETDTPRDCRRLINLRELVYEQKS